MKITFKYVLSTREGFRQEYDTPEEASQHFYANVEALLDIVKQRHEAEEGCPDYCDYELKRERDYFLTGNIDTYIDDEFKYYELKTITY